MTIVKGGGSVTAAGAGPPAYVTSWYYPPQCGAMDPGTTGVTTTDTRLYYIPIFIFQTHTFTNMAVYNSGAGDSGDDVRLGVYSHHASYGPRTLEVDMGEVSFGASAAKTEATAGTIALTKGWWWIAVHCNGAADMYAIRSRVASSMLWRLQADFGVPAVNSATLDCVNGFPYVDTTYGALATNAVAPTTCTSIVPKVWLKA